MIRTEIRNHIQKALESLHDEGLLPQLPACDIEISDPRQPEHGDFATNIALVASKQVGKNPRELADLICSKIELGEFFVSKEIAGPGFINFRIHESAYSACIQKLVTSPDLALPASTTPKKSLNLEFVSVNPNGPITVGSGRGGALGSTLANVFEAAGHPVHREYYINDGVNSEQMRLFAESVRSYVEELPFPEQGYKGDYVKEVADQIKSADAPLPASVLEYQQHSQELMIQRQRVDLSNFGIEYQTWFSEQSLHDKGWVDRDIAELEQKGIADDRPIRTKIKFGKGGVIDEVDIENQPQDDDDVEAQGNTLWLRSTKFGDDMDRVLRRKDGRLTYIASDIAYHKDKFCRGSKPDTTGKTLPADKLITILGPDHHGYIGRLHAVVGALLEDKPSGSSSESILSDTDSKIYSSPAEREACRRALEESKERLEVLIFQIVRFVKNGQPAPMRKRDGNIYSLRDLIMEIGQNSAPDAPESEQLRIGKDVTRFFYLMRSHDTHMDFDLDLAEKQSDENPVFYVQYAHARICSVLEKAAEAGFALSDHAAVRLNHPREISLIKKILDLPTEIERCAADYGVHRLTTYAIDLARSYHAFYDACRVIQPEQVELTHSRIALCVVTRNTLRRVFDILGISAPDRM